LLPKSDFKAKIHQNRVRLGLHPIPRWESLQHPSWNKGDLLLTEGRGAWKGERKGREVKGREGRGGRKGGQRKEGKVEEKGRRIKGGERGDSPYQI